jgi:hypothetical protein
MNSEFLKNFFIGVLFGFLFLVLFLFLRPWNASIPFDFLIHYQASERILAGKSPYLSWELPTLYNYPPTVFPFIFWLSFFEKQRVFVVWQVLSALALLVAAFLLARIVQDYKIEKPGLLASLQGSILWKSARLFQEINFRTLLVFLGFLLFFPTRFGFFMGQINNFVLLCLCLFFYFLFKKKDFVAGLFLTIAIFLKITPVIFVPYLLLKGRRKALVAFFSVGMVLFLFFGAFFGFDHFFLWQEALAGPLFSISGKAAYYNQALSGFTARTFGETSLAFSSTLFLETVFLITSFSLILAGNFLKKKDFDFLEISLILVTMLFVNRLTWQHHLIFCLPAFVFASYHFINEKKRLPLFVLAACFILLSGNVPYFEALKNEPLSFIYLSHGVLGLLVFWVFLAFYYFFDLNQKRG